MRSRPRETHEGKSRQQRSWLRLSRLLGPFSGLTILGCAVGCAALDESSGSTQEAATPIDRMLIGQASKYPADTSLREKTPVFEQSMAERRKLAWSIVQKVLEPVKTVAPSAQDPSALLELPRFQTWYSKDDFQLMFGRLANGLSRADRQAHAPFTAQALSEIFPWDSTAALSLPSFTEERLLARKKELATTKGAHSLGKDARILMSPGYVNHLFRSYANVLACSPTGTPPAGTDETSFAPCLASEFPSDAVAVKSRWMPDSSPVPTYDTSAASLGEKLKRGSFGDGDGHADPGENDAYTMQLTPDTKMRLVALHIMTKELRDWAWITLWWSPDANSDFGADRPETMTGVFSHYKMCVVTAYEEKDGTPGASFAKDHPSLAAALDAAAATGPSTWCSNPYLETQEHAATTSCIGCHQNGGTGESPDSVLAAPDRFPDFGRKKVRSTFPADYTFTTDGVMDLRSDMSTRINPP